TVRRHLQQGVVDDLLFNVVFGRLTPTGVRAILLGSGMPGLETAILHHIATFGFLNYRELRDRFGVSAGTLRDRVARLQMAGLLLQPSDGGQQYFAGPAARAYLRICEQLYRLAASQLPLAPETEEVLRTLQIEPVRDLAKDYRYSDDWLGVKTPEAGFNIMVGLSVAARYQWNVDWDNLSMTAHPDELDRTKWLQFG
ncbi:MAG TPA: helix-turn-helix domain-containing protein, partial [Gemmatimonadales bacterium]|nr:helix-turn-helix domain-containing protein [Gemmatimonadales bacterium]